MIYDAESNFLTPGIESAIRRLPLIDGITEDAIQSSLSLIEGAAIVGSYHERPQTVNATERKARKQVKAYIEKCNQLASEIRNMNRNTITAIQVNLDGADHPNMILEEIEKAAKNAEMALKMDDFPSLEPVFKVRKALATQVTKAAAREYQKLTGRRPTLSVQESQPAGIFYTFLTEIFEALGIEASPEAQIRAMEKHAQKMP